MSKLPSFSGRLRPTDPKHVSRNVSRPNGYHGHGSSGPRQSQRFNQLLRIFVSCDQIKTIQASQRYVSREDRVVGSGLDEFYVKKLSGILVRSRIQKDGIFEFVGVDMNRRMKLCWIGWQ